jgi:hypothetical protein
VCFGAKEEEGEREREREISTRYLNCKIVPFALFANKKIILYFST